MNGATISPRLPASSTLPAGSSPRLPATNSLPPGSSSSLSFNFNSLSPVKGLSSPAKSGGVPLAGSPAAPDGNFAYRDPRLPANWWVSVEWVGGGDLRYGYHSPAGDRLRSPSEVAHYLQVLFKTFSQCCGSVSRSTGSTCFWTSRIRIRIQQSEVSIYLSTCKNSKKKTLIPTIL